MKQNFNFVYQTSFKNDSFSKLQKYCNDLISKEPDKVFKSLDFSSTPENLLVTLIQGNGLQMSEIQIWEHVLKWGLAKNPQLPSDPTNFSKEDFITLRDSLQQFIPFIKFYNLTSEEFLDEVLPYKKLLTKELYKDLLNHFLNPNNQPIKRSVPNTIKDIEENNSKIIDSKIITFRHAELILEWVNLDAFTSMFSKWFFKDATYKFKLLLRGSRDGFTLEKFHEICDNQPHTVTIIKVKDSTEILGGYNPIAWKVCGYSSTRDSFIFSFKNAEDIDDHILSRVIDKECAILNRNPSFGFYDLHLFDESYCSRMCYEKSIRETKDAFFYEEYEVFQIIRD